jgi:membrane protease YdiL (CAAX protease family)
MELLIMAPLALVITLGVRRQEAFRLHCRPEQATWVAVAVGLGAFGLSLLLLAFDPRAWIHAVINYVGIWVVCGFALPWFYGLLVERSGPAGMGLTRERWKLSLGLNLILGGFFIMVVVTQADWSTIDLGKFWTATFVLLTGNLFELFLYYGFIHLRLERAFGVIPAILGAAAIYALWHVGTELTMYEQFWLGLGKLFLVGVMYQSVFSITRNLLTIWPFFVGGGVLVDFVLDIKGMGSIASEWPWAVFVILLMALFGVGLAMATRRDRGRQRTISR